VRDAAPRIRALEVAAWVILIGVAFVTVAPIQFRPETPFGPNAERFAAFLLVGFLFGLVYARRMLLAVIFAIGAAVVLEALQRLVPTRHGESRDLYFKLAGAALGLAVGWVLAPRRPRPPKLEETR
jgi:VanZ family protein